MLLRLFKIASFFPVLYVLVILFLIVEIPYWIIKGKWLSESNLKSISQLIYRFINWATNPYIKDNIKKNN